MSGPTIRARITCSKCGYDLEGLDADAKCPECGQEIMATLAARLDPATESLARSRDTLRVAWGVYLACVGSVLGCALALAPVIDLARASITPPAWVAPGVDGVRAVSPSVAVVGAVVGLVGLAAVLPWGRRKALLRARVVGCAGFAAWLVLALRAPSLDNALAALGAVAAVVASLTPLLRELVPYSRVYRSARHATQTTRDLLVAAGVSLGSGVAALLIRRQQVASDELVPYLAIAAYGSAMFLFVGLCYRLANAHWALASVRRPPPRVADVLGD